MPSRDLIPTGDDDHAWALADELQSREIVWVHPPTSYRQAFGDKPIRLGLIEFRILMCLSQRPYYAFTRRQIADALAANATVVDEPSIDIHIATLRDQLGVLSDFVQSVPHVGYRYKA
jgi:DNA-binding response OmpR family regulator